MAGENTAESSAKKANEASEQGRQRSTISFPYMDLNSAIELVDAIHSNCGLGDCDDDQLAAWTDQSTKSSSFRLQIATARMFGVIEGASGRHRLTELGKMIVDPSRAREGKSRAFLNVPLYNAVYEKYRGGVLPPAAAFERDIVGLGVAEKQKDKARQAFERSAQQAGYFEHGRNKLVMPAVAVKPEAPAAPEEQRENGGGGGGGGGGTPPGIDPIIGGLLARLPPSGSVWAEAERDLWLELLKGSFKLIYKNKGDLKDALQ